MSLSLAEQTIFSSLDAWETSLWNGWITWKFKKNHLSAAVLPDLLHSHSEGCSTKGGLGSASGGRYAKFFNGDTGFFTGTPAQKELSEKWGWLTWALSKWFYKNIKTLTWCNSRFKGCVWQPQARPMGSLYNLLCMLIRVVLHPKGLHWPFALHLELTKFNNRDEQIVPSPRKSKLIPKQWNAIQTFLYSSS